MRAIIVDDEPKAIELIKSYLTHFKSVELLGSFRNALKAFEFITSNSIDLIFLDINMPHLSGMSLSKLLPDGVKIVFTTAYSEYAVESYEVKAVDYLLKPISLERFGQCMTRLLEPTELKSTEHESQNHIHVKDGTQVHRILLANCLFLKKDGNYVHYITTSRKVMTRQTIAEALELLGSHFLQIHKSYIVNMDKIDSFNNQAVTIGTEEIPIGESYRREVRDSLT